MTAFAEYWERIRLRIDDGFRQWIPELFGGLPEPQLEAVLRSMEAGKRIRGCLVCLTCEALGGDIEAALPRAVGIECIHAASLIHDDVVDGDAVRRERPAEWTLQGSRRAVLLGDVMFATVIQKMVEQSIEEGSLVANVIATMAKGAYQEHLERSSLERSAGENNYDAIIHFKTGVLFGAAAQLGALVATSSDAARGSSFTFGARLGEAYQIADDLAEVRDLERRSDFSRPALAATAPILLRFSATTARDYVRLMNDGGGHWDAWAERELPPIKDRMRSEIAARCERAGSALDAFPDNPFTRLLREMPADIVRAMAAEEEGRGRRSISPR